MSAHTPGPWQYSQISEVPSNRMKFAFTIGDASMVPCENAIGYGGRIVAYVPICQFAPEDLVHEADACIIAASPAMLDELKRLDGLGVSVDWDRFPELQKNGMTPR